MVQTFNLSGIIDILQNIATRSFIINDFGFGNTYDLNARPNINYPILWVEPTQTKQKYTGPATGYRTIQYGFNLYILDRLTKGDTNYQELLNDTLYNLFTVVSELEQDISYVNNNVNLIEDIVYDPITYVYDDYTNGYRAAVKILVPDRYTPCNNPIALLPITTSTTTTTTSSIQTIGLVIEGKTTFTASNIHIAYGIDDPYLTQPSFSYDTVTYQGGFVHSIIVPIGSSVTLVGSSATFSQIYPTNGSTSSYPSDPTTFTGYYTTGPILSGINVAYLNINPTPYVPTTTTTTTTVVPTTTTTTSTSSTSTTTTAAPTTTTTTTTSTSTTTTTLSPYNLTLLDSNNNVIRNDNSLTSMMSFIGSSYSFTQPTTLQFNNSNTYYLTSMLQVEFNNNGHTFSMINYPGQRPVLDVQQLDLTVLYVGMSNFSISGFHLKNARPCSIPAGGDEGGTILRLLGNSSNINVNDMILDTGFCGIRATTNISNLRITNITVLSVWALGFRLGTGAWLDQYGRNTYYNYDIAARPKVQSPSAFDMENVYLENITCIDNLNGGTVSGTQQPGNPSGSVYSGGFILKITNGLTVKNAVLTGKSVVAVENSYNVLLDSIYAHNITNSEVFLISQTDGLTIQNSYAQDVNDGSSRYLSAIDYCRNISMYYNTFTSLNSSCAYLLFTNTMIMKELAGNIFQGYNNPAMGVQFATNASINSGTYGFGYTASMAQDWLSEHDNVWSTYGSYYPWFELSGLGASGGALPFNATDTSVSISNPALTDKYTPDTYQGYGYGNNSQFVLYPDGLLPLTTRINPDGSTSSAVYLDPTSAGSQGIPAPLTGLTFSDLGGYIRVYPTDMGAFDRNAVVLA